MLMIGDALLDAIAAEPDDRIWQRAIDLSELIPTRYDDVAAATLAAISRAHHRDTLSAIATCLLEHLLEHDFSLFETLERNIRAGDDKLLYILSLCAKFGSSENPANTRRWDSLLSEFSDRRRRFDLTFPPDPTSS